MVGTLQAAICGYRLPVSMARVRRHPACGHGDIRIILDLIQEAF